MVNSYGKLAHDVFEESEFGSCIMQDEKVDTFSYTVMWAGVERMGMKNIAVNVLRLASRGGS